MSEQPEKQPDLVICFILDESGSMSTEQDVTISGVNEYIKEQSKEAKEKKQKVLLSISKFNSSMTMLHEPQDIHEIPRLDSQSYNPGGMTALYDAIGKTIVKVEADMDKKLWRPSILCVIVTDGGENSSEEYQGTEGLAAIRKLIIDKEKQGNWTFVFLGTNADAWSVGASMGASASNAVRYCKSETQNVYRSLSAQTSSRKADQAATGQMRTDDFFARSSDVFQKIQPLPIDKKKDKEQDKEQDA